MFEFKNNWGKFLNPEFEKEYYINLRRFLKSEYMSGKHRIFPDMNDIFNAFLYTDYDKVKAVIIGQDPYHGFGQAHGLCFSVKKGIQTPPSLVNIFKELHDDLGCSVPSHGELTQWTENGVLLLNSVLTVREGMAGSHRNQGWERFTDKAISALNQRETPICFLLWGNYAKEKEALITNPVHPILTASHPSPLSAYNGFFGCKHFSKCNDSLGEKINWQIT